MFHIAAEENGRECMKLLVYHFKVDPDEPDVVSCCIIVIVRMIACVCVDQLYALHFSNTLDW